MQLLDGKATSEQLKQEIAGKVAAIKKAGGKVPHLAAVLVGNDGGSMTYVNNKVLACKACGFGRLVRMTGTWLATSVALVAMVTPARLASLQRSALGS